MKPSEAKRILSTLTESDIRAMPNVEWQLLRQATGRHWLNDGSPGRGEASMSHHFLDIAKLPPYWLVPEGQLDPYIALAMGESGYPDDAELERRSDLGVDDAFTLAAVECEMAPLRGCPEGYARGKAETSKENSNGPTKAD